MIGRSGWEGGGGRVRESTWNCGGQSGERYDRRGPYKGTEPFGTAIFERNCLTGTKKSQNYAFKEDIPDTTGKIINIFSFLSFGPVCFEHMETNE